MGTTIATRRHALCALISASAVGLPACSPAPPTSHLGIRAETGNTEEESASSLHVIPVRGTLVVADGKIDARLEPFASPFASPFSAAHQSAELYVPGFPTEEFDAEVIDVVPLGDGWYRATARLRLTDARLQRGAAVDGIIIARDKGELASTKSKP